VSRRPARSLCPSKGLRKGEVFSDQDLVECPNWINKEMQVKLVPLHWMAPSIRKSDDRNFYLVLADAPRSCTPGRNDLPTECLSLGFWCVLACAPEEIQTVSILLVCPPSSFAQVEAQIRLAADLLAHHVGTGRPLCSEYEFDGRELTEMTLTYRG
jgi:hypothetical protein